MATGVSFTRVMMSWGRSPPAAAGERRCTLGDDHALAHGETELRRQILVDVVERDAEEGPHVASGGEHLVGHRHGGVDRDGEAESRHALAEELGGVDPDEVAARIDERPARVARADRGVGLDERFAAERAPGTIDGGDDPGGDGTLEAERIADGDRELADLELIGVAERRDGRIGDGNADDRDVEPDVAPEDGARDLASVGEAHLHGARGADDVRVGEDHPIATDHHPRPGAELRHDDAHHRGRHLSGDADDGLLLGGERRLRGVRLRVGAPDEGSGDEAATAERDTGGEDDRAGERETQSGRHDRAGVWERSIARRTRRGNAPQRCRKRAPRPIGVLSRGAVERIFGDPLPSPRNRCAPSSPWLLS